MSAAIYTCGTARLDGCPGRLDLCFSPGFMFDAVIQRWSTATEDPEDWPIGTSTRIQFIRGTGTTITFGGTIDGPYLRFQLTGTQTADIPRAAAVIIAVNYGSGDPTQWRSLLRGRMQSC